MYRQSADHLRRRRARHATHSRPVRLVRPNDDGLDAFNPADIETIEVIKGPAASTLYGAEARPA
jgi:outer membrane receptor protein involved in Fe transport